MYLGNWMRNMKFGIWLWSCRVDQNRVKMKSEQPRCVAETPVLDFCREAFWWLWIYSVTYYFDKMLDFSIKKSTWMIARWISKMSSVIIWRASVNIHLYALSPLLGCFEVKIWHNAFVMCTDKKESMWYFLMKKYFVLLKYVSIDHFFIKWNES